MVPPTGLISLAQVSLRFSERRHFGLKLRCRQAGSSRLPLGSTTGTRRTSLFHDLSGVLLRPLGLFPSFTRFDKSIRSEGRGNQTAPGEPPGWTGIVPAASFSSPPPPLDGQNPAGSAGTLSGATRSSMALAGNERSSRPVSACSALATPAAIVRFFPAKTESEPRVGRR